MDLKEGIKHIDSVNSSRAILELLNLILSLSVLDTLGKMKFTEDVMVILKYIFDTLCLFIFF